jgi:hypothetical protein
MLHPKDNEAESFIVLTEEHCRVIDQARGQSAVRVCGRLGHGCQNAQSYHHSLVQLYFGFILLSILPQPINLVR